MHQRGARDEDIDTDGLRVGGPLPNPEERAGPITVEVPRWAARMMPVLR